MSGVNVGVIDSHGVNLGDLGLWTGLLTSPLRLVS